MDENAIAKLVAGVDEAGRGPLAGSVVAAAVILDENFPIDGLTDSKKLSASRRTTLDTPIRVGSSRRTHPRARRAGTP